MIGNILRYRYELIEKIGDGFLFSVFRARDRVQNRIITIKLLQSPYNENSQITDLLRETSFNVSKLSSTSIARVFELDKHENTPFVVTEYARGANLKERIRRVAPISVPVAIDTAIGIAEGLDACHRAGIVHADLCPQNVIVGMEGTVKVTDFGLTQVYCAEPALFTAFWNRIAPYLPVETAKGSEPTLLTDIYSLGIILFEMLTGDLPFLANTPDGLASIRSGRTLPSIRNLNPGVHTTVEEIVIKATQDNPKERYSSMTEFLYDLKTVRDALRFGKPLTWSPLTATRNIPPLSYIPDSVTALPIHQVINQVAQETPAPTLIVDSKIEAVPTNLKASEPKPSAPPQNETVTQPITISAPVETPIPKPEITETAQAPTIIKAPEKIVETKPVQKTTVIPEPKPKPPVKEKKERPLIEAPKAPQPASKTEVIYEDVPIPWWLRLMWATLLIVLLLGGVSLAGVLFFHWLAPPEVHVPDLIGKSRIEARSWLDRNGLQMEEVRQEYNEKYPADTVFYTSPASKKFVKKGSKVQVWISQGSRHVQIPNVKGLRTDEAKKTLSDLGLAVAVERKQESSDTVPAGQVIRQTPEPNNKVERGELVRLTISNGKSIQQPESQQPQVDFGEMRVFEISITLPSGQGDTPVSIEVVDEFGTRTDWKAELPPGTQLVRKVSAYGNNIKIRVNVNGSMFREMEFGPK